MMASKMYVYTCYVMLLETVYCSNLIVLLFVNDLHKIILALSNDSVHV